MSISGSNRPGCFGFASTYEPDSDCCKACEHNAECAETALKRAEHISKLQTYLRSIEDGKSLKSKIRA